jgi:hypothetical protein
MANHEKKRAINQRAGCKLCKPWKLNGVGREAVPPSSRRTLQESISDIESEAHYYYDLHYEDDWWDDQDLLEYMKEYNVK